jgi:hypothetical protein
MEARFLCASGEALPPPPRRWLPSIVGSIARLADFGNAALPKEIRFSRRC